LANLAANNFNQNAHQEEKKGGRKKERRGKESLFEGSVFGADNNQFCHLGSGFFVRVECLEAPGVNIIMFLNIEVDFVSPFKFCLQNEGSCVL